MTVPYIICNYQSCEMPLLKIGWVTICSHAYCCHHGDEFFGYAAKIIKCPSCGRKLNSDGDVVRNDFDPSHLVIPFVHPIKLTEFAMSSMRFWTRQMEYRRKVAHDHLTRKFESDLIESTNRLQIENRELKKHVRCVERKLKEVQEELLNSRTKYNKYKTAYYSTEHRTSSRLQNSSPENQTNRGNLIVDADRISQRWSF